MTVLSESKEPLWLYGYGSLLFKPPLHHLDIHHHFKRFDGHTKGFIRRFWQSSYDNRGTPEFKGRVVTIIPADEIIKSTEFQADVLQYELNHIDFNEKSRIFDNEAKLREPLLVSGCVYYIPPEYANEASEYLDFREKDGYITQEIEFHVSNANDDLIFDDLKRNENGEPIVKCIVYVGTTDNESFIGPENPIDTAEIIARAEGESGPNDEYLIRLAEEVEKMGVEDKYLNHLKELIDNKKPSV